MFNQVTLLGNLTRDIELRYSQSGSAIAKTAIATSHKFTVNGEKREETMFIDITFFGRSGEIANQYLRKGSKVLIIGRLQLEQWTDQQSGQKRSKHSVIVEEMKMIDSKRDEDQNTGSNAPVYKRDTSGNESYQGNYSKPAPAKMPDHPSEIDIDEDEIPF